MSDEYKSKLVSLPGTKLSPEVLLHQTLNKKHRIKNVTIVIQWDDDTFDCDWSTMKVSELCMASMMLSHNVNLVMTNSHPDVETVKDK